jgi:ABC-2 type transport system permease protein
MPIFDQGYHHWSGTLSGHSWRWLAVTRNGIRVALTNRWLRIVMLVSWVPAFLLAGMLCVWGLIEQKSTLIDAIRPILTFLDDRMFLQPQDYRKEIWTLSYGIFMNVELTASMLLVLLVGPNLISQDLRYNALPLYFSRPMRRIDYFLGKLGIIVGCLGMVTILPAVIAYALGLLFSLDLSIVPDTFPILLRSIAYGLVISISAGTLVLALSCLSRNSRYIALFWLALWIGTNMVEFVLVNVDMQQRIYQAGQSGDISYPQIMERELEASRTNWRPLTAYTGNLSRVGRFILGSDKEWYKFSRRWPPDQRAGILFQWRGYEYPWTWSAGVLIGVFVLSAWILNRSIKSLDRLK